jgi:hypothetical protein
MGMDNRLWEVTRVSEYLKNIQPTFYHSTQNLAMNNITFFGSASQKSKKYFELNCRSFGLDNVHNDMTVYLHKQCGNIAADVK